MKRLLIIPLALCLSGCFVTFHWIGGFPWGHVHHVHNQPPHPCEPYPQCHIDDSHMGKPEYEPH